MNSWSLKELERNHHAWDCLVDARLQTVVYNPKKVLFLEFYKQQSILLFIDLRKPNCFIGVLKDKKAPKKLKKDQPISLFLRSHFVGKSLKLVELCSQFGRVLRFHFSEELKFEVRLFPKDTNCIAETADKKMSYDRPTDLEPLEDNYIPKEYRDFFDASASWWAEFSGSAVNLSVKEDPQKAKAKALKKIEKQKEKLHRQLKELSLGTIEEQLAIFEEFGESSEKYLKDRWASLEGELWHQKMAGLYVARKKAMQKKQGILQRFEELTKEKQQIEKGVSLNKEALAKSSTKADLQKVTGAKTKSKNISSDLRIHIGKTAKENVLLLRKAKPWYLWMHLKDRPGSHLIVEKNKNRDLSLKELQSAALELLKSMGEAGTQVIQYAECRYIKPIKGDKLGRVKVTQEKTLTVQGEK